MAIVKLAVTADLHLPITSPATIAQLAREVAAFAPAAFVLAGDIAETLSDLQRCLTLLKQQVGCPVLVLPGNHDLWKGEVSSLQKWRTNMPHVVEAAGCVWLEGNAFCHQGVAVAGSIGWYDYSAADPGIQASVLEFATRKIDYNLDAAMIDWHWSDPDFAALVGDGLLATLDRLEADPTVRQTVVVTHVPLLECQMCRDSGNPDWAFSNAYFGNLTLGKKVLERKKVVQVISGHTHVGRRATLRLDDGRVIGAYVLNSHYGKPLWLQLVLEVEAETPQH